MEESAPASVANMAWDLSTSTSLSSEKLSLLSKSRLSSPSFSSSQSDRRQQSLSRRPAKQALCCLATCCPFFSVQWLVHLSNCTNNPFTDCFIRRFAGNSRCSEGGLVKVYPVSIHLPHVLLENFNDYGIRYVAEWVSFGGTIVSSVCMSFNREQKFYFKTVIEPKKNDCKA